jgi:hypothetical protein
MTVAEGQSSGTRKRPEIAGDKRRLRRTEGSELNMLAELGTQAREIVALATTAERDETFRSFRNYSEFRRKVSEFEAFCNIIENHLKDVVGDRREELEERFYRLWSTIFHPTVRALTAFFGRLVQDDVLPLGCRDMLEGELRALDAMRAALLAPRFAHAADQTMVAEIGELQVMLQSLVEKSTSLPDLSIPSEGEEEEEEAAVPQPAASAPAAAPGRPDPASALNIGNVPNVKAVRDLRALLDTYRRDAGFGPYVETDSRALDEIERRFLANPMDGGAIVWLRQIGNAWIARMGDDAKDIRRVLSNVRSS